MRVDYALCALWRHVIGVHLICGSLQSPLIDSKASGVHRGQYATYGGM